MSLLAIYCYLPQCSADRSTPPMPVPPDTGTFACHNGSALSSNWPLLCCSPARKREETCGIIFAPQVSRRAEHLFTARLSPEVAKTKSGEEIISWKWSDISFNAPGIWCKDVENVHARRWPRIPFVFKCGVKHCGRSLMQHGECISTAVRVMDRGASLSIAAACFYLHTIDLQGWECRLMRERDGRKEGEYMCVAVQEEGLKGAGEVCPIAGVIKFVSRTHLVSPGCSSLIHNRC